MFDSNASQLCTLSQYDSTPMRNELILAYTIPINTVQMQTFDHVTSTKLSTNNCSRTASTRTLQVFCTNQACSTIPWGFSSTPYKAYSRVAVLVSSAHKYRYFSQLVEKIFQNKKIATIVLLEKEKKHEIRSTANQRPKLSLNVGRKGRC